MLSISLNYKDPRVFIRSQWQDDLSFTFLIYRWILAAYFNFVVVLSFVTAIGCNQFGWYTIYLTNWNVILNGSTSLIGVIITTLCYKKKICVSDLTATPMPFKVYWLLATLSCVISITLACVYWPFIYVGRDKGLNDALTHAGNSIVYFVDIFINAFPPRFGHALYVVLFGLCYCAFSVVYTVLGGTDRDYKNYIYSVLDWKEKADGALIFAFATLLFLAFMHFVVTGLILLRIKIHQHLCRRNATNESEHTVDNLGFQGNI